MQPFGVVSYRTGAEGVQHAYSILQGELYRGMAQLGIRSPGELGPRQLLRIGGVRAPGMPV